MNKPFERRLFVSVMAIGALALLTLVGCQPENFTGNAGSGTPAPQQAIRLSEPVKAQVTEPTLSTQSKPPSFNGEQKVEGGLPVTPLPGTVRVGAPEELTLINERIANGWLTNIRLDSDVLFATVKEGDQTRPVAIDLLTKDLAQLDETFVKGGQWAILPSYFDWIESPDGRSEKLYVYDLSTSKKTAIPGTSNNQRWPSMAGNTIVWAEVNGDHSWDIYAYNVTTSQITTAVSRPGVQAYPKTDGNWIVYLEDNDSQPDKDIYLHNLLSAEDILLGSSPFAAQCQGCTYSILRDQVVWVGQASEQTTQQPPNLNVYDLNTRQAKMLGISAACPIRGFISSANLIAWGCYSDHMTGYDLEQKTVFDFPMYPEVVQGKAESWDIYLSDKWIVWLVAEREGNAVLPRTPGASVPTPSSSEEFTPTKRKFRWFAAPITR